MEYDYDELYEEKDLFGEQYIGLIDYFKSIEKKKTLCDLGAGQGRDSIPFSRIGFDVTAVDISQVGLDDIKKQEPKVNCIKADIYSFLVEDFDIVFMDSLLHFEEPDLIREKQLVKRVCKEMKRGAFYINCINNIDEAVKIFKETLSESDIEYKVIHEDILEFPNYDIVYHFYVIEKL